MNATLLHRIDLNLFAEQLAMKHFPRGRVDPEVIARKEGITVLHTAFRDEIDGLLLQAHGRDVIVCNSRRAPRCSERCRFTIAHELGHFFARKAAPYPLVARVPGASQPGERSADRFAAHLLMPQASFLREYDSLTVAGLARVAVLGSVFGTSLAATAYRALELDCFSAPAAVLLWDPCGERCGRRVSPETCWLGAEYLELAESAPMESVTALALGSLAIGLRTGRAPVMKWFTWLSGYECAHQGEIEEEVMSRGGHGWITLLIQ